KPAQTEKASRRAASIRRHAGSSSGNVRKDEPPRGPWMAIQAIRPDHRHPCARRITTTSERLAGIRGTTLLRPGTSLSQGINPRGRSASTTALFPL
ncbi:MAG: hypothetical protein ABIJ86_08715, partial [Spirochaetota bacterium]